jgi:AcrR family transcriptional regulator
MTTTGRPYTLRKRAQSTEDTRRRIIKAARDLIESSGYSNISLDRIADAAGISRQTIYVQFGSKLGVLSAMVDEIDNAGLQELFSSVRESTDPVELMRRIIPQNIDFMHENARIFRIFRAQAVSDPDFRSVLDERMALRFGNIHRLVQWLHHEGKLAAGWTVDEAAEWLATFTGFHTYDEMVNQRGWTLDHLNARLLETVETVILAPGTRSGE